MSTLFSDLNVKLAEVNDSDTTIITDSDTIKQSLIRLIFTGEGTVPNFRRYGLDLTKFLHYPINTNTSQEIYEYIIRRIEYFEKRVTRNDNLSKAIFDFENGTINIKITLEVPSTNEIITLPIIPVSTGR